LGLWRVSCLLQRFWPVLFKIWSSSLVPDLLSSGVYIMTRAPQRRSLSSSAPAAGSSGHGGSRFPACGRHAPEGLSLFGARVGHVPPFLAVHGVGWGQRWSFLCWVRPGTARVLHAPPSPADSSIVFCRKLLWVFLFSMYIPMCLLCITVYLFVMHKCLWAYLVSW
jgi:hypothetical protein